MILALDRIRPGSAEAAGHRQRLLWHTVTPSGGPAGALLCLGEKNLRCSADLGTGAAGYLLALSDLRDPMHAVLRLPTREHLTWRYDACQHQPLTQGTDVASPRWPDSNQPHTPGARELAERLTRSGGEGDHHEMRRSHR